MTANHVIREGNGPFENLRQSSENDYPPTFNDLCITSILNKLYASEGVVQNGPKRDVFTNAVNFFRDYLLKY